VIVGRLGTSLAVSLTGGNRHKRPFADRGYDFDKYRRLLWQSGIKPFVARAALRMGPASATPAGARSGPSTGCTGSSDRGSAANGGPTSTGACSN
jgi:hypothetical protein